MHSNLSITDGVYGMLSDQDVEERITALGKQKSKGKFSDRELVKRLEDILIDLKKGSG